MTLTIEEQFIEIKAMEAEIKQKRFEIEAKIANAYRYDVGSGKSSRYITEGGDGKKLSVKFTSSTSRKVDIDKIREIQTQYGIPEEEINRLFQFKAELNLSEYNSLPKGNKEVLGSAISITTNKPTLNITSIETEKE